METGINTPTEVVLYLLPVYHVTLTVSPHYLARYLGAGSLVCV